MIMMTTPNIEAGRQTDRERLLVNQPSPSSSETSKVQPKYVVGYGNLQLSDASNFIRQTSKTAQRQLI